MYVSGERITAVEYLLPFDQLCFEILIQILDLINWLADVSFLDSIFDQVWSFSKYLRVRYFLCHCVNGSPGFD